MIPRMLMPSVPIVAGLILLVASACGIITAPFSVPSAIATNHNAQLDGAITDADGMRLDNVTLTVQKDHFYWDAIMGGHPEYEDSSSLVSGSFSVWRRGSSRVRLIFAKPGYVPAVVEFDDKSFYFVKAATTRPNASDVGVITDNQPEQPYNGGFFAHRMDRTYPIYVDPVWKPGNPVRIILYAEPAMTGPATSR